MDVFKVFPFKVSCWKYKIPDKLTAKKPFFTDIVPLHNVFSDAGEMDFVFRLVPHYFYVFLFVPAIQCHTSK